MLAAPTAMATTGDQIALGSCHLLSLHTDGSLWASGSNDTGAIGDGTTTWQKKPVQIGTGFASVTAGHRSAALKKDGTLWSWGAGSVGDGTNLQRNAPVQIGTGFSSVVMSVGGNHSLAMKSDGSLWAWGANGAGQLGDGSETDRTVLVKVGTGFTTFAAGSSHSLALKSDGSLWLWGSNDQGQLGTGTAGPYNCSFSSNACIKVPTQLGTGYAAIAAGGDSSFAIKTDGTLWAWGPNYYGQLGDGSKTNRSVPVKIGTGYRSVATSGGHTVAIKTDGTVWAWGSGKYGQIGDGQWGSFVEDRTTPLQVASGIASVYANNSTSMGLQSDGGLWVWGDNSCGQFGDGTFQYKTLPTYLDGERIFKFAEATYSSYLKSSDGVSRVADIYYYRAYSGPAFLAASGGNVFYLGPASGNAIITLGTTETWLRAAIAAGF